MEKTSWITGLVLIGIGFLVKAAPNLIAGYNTMTKEQKEKVDIVGLSSFMKNGLIIIGLSIIIGYYFFNLIKFPLIANSMVTISGLGGIIILVIKAQKFDKNKSKAKQYSTYIILGIVSLFIFGSLYYGTQPSEITIDNESFHIKGMYGFELKNSEIQTALLIENIPAILLRTNGFSFGTIKKGHFKLEEYGICVLFLNSDKGPFLLITRKNGEKIVINYSNKTDTKQTYDRLNSVINRQ